MHNPKCAANHFGPWAVEVGWFRQAVEAVRSGVWAMAEPPDPKEMRMAYVMGDGDLALFSIDGPITRGQSKYGGTSSVELRQGIRAAANDPKVNGIFVTVDSPGGTVAGTAELADEIRAANTKKPVFAYVEGQAASAAYWAVAHAERISASSTSMVGSIGAFAVLEDTSKAAELAGIKVHVVSSGALKGAGVPGTAVTEDQISETQAIVDEVAEIFFSDVRAGRSMGVAEINAVKDGRLLTASMARKMKLIDGAESFEAAYSRAIEKSKPAKKSKLARAEAGIRLAEQ